MRTSAVDRRGGAREPLEHADGLGGRQLGRRFGERRLNGSLEHGDNARGTVAIEAVVDLRYRDPEVFVTYRP